ncbi:hypothetical protein HC761_01300 [bacterium]|nr:hypothetical protein [bacterium]
MSVAHWATFAELGWLGAGLTEEQGGFGGSAIEFALIAEQFGKALVVEPFVGAVLQDIGEGDLLQAGIGLSLLHQRPTPINAPIHEPPGKPMCACECQQHFGVQGGEPPHPILDRCHSCVFVQFHGGRWGRTRSVSGARQSFAILWPQRL